RSFVVYVCRPRDGAMGDDSEGLKVRLETVQRDLQKNESAYDKLDDKLATLSQSVTDINRDLDNKNRDLDNKITTLTQNTDAKISTLTEETDAKISQADQNLDAKIHAVSQRAATLEATLNTAKLVGIVGTVAIAILGSAGIWQIVRNQLDVQKERTRF